LQSGYPLKVIEGLQSSQSPQSTLQGLLMLMANIISKLYWVEG